MNPFRTLFSCTNQLTVKSIRHKLAAFSYSAIMSNVAPSGHVSFLVSVAVDEQIFVPLDWAVTLKRWKWCSVFDAVIDRGNLQKNSEMSWKEKSTEQRRVSKHFTVASKQKDVFFPKKTTPICLCFGFGFYMSKFLNISIYFLDNEI